MAVNIPLRFLMGSCFALCAWSPAAERNDLVPLRKIDATIREEMRFAQYNNPLGKPAYDVPVCVLREPVAMALARVQQIARLQNIGLKVLDCYRPLSVHQSMKATPEGCDTRCAGGSVDVTLLDSSANDLVMPGKFGAPAGQWEKARDGVSKKAKKNHSRMAELMKQEGFKQVAGSWSRFEWKDSASFAKEDRPLGDFK